jgi:acyl transferase domain-containing protein
MDPILTAFEQAVSAVTLHAPRVPLVSNLTGKLLTDDEATDPTRWRRHIREPVRFAQSVQTLADLGVRSFLEIGPHPTLCALARTVVLESGVLWLPSLRRGAAAWGQLLESVGAMYRAGYEFDWRGFTRDHAGRRTAGPTYAFQRKRFWFTDDLKIAETPVGAFTPSGPLARHPLLGAAIDSPAVSGWAFESVFTRQRQPSYLAEYKFRGQILVPVAVFIEMMIGAGLEGPGWQHLRLEKLGFEQPLIVPDGGRRCQVIVARPNDGRALLRVMSSSQATDGQSVWNTHAVATVITAKTERPIADPPLTELRAAAKVGVNLPALFSHIETRGIEQGPSFRTLREAWKGAFGALGHAQIPEEMPGETGYSAVHPCLLDAGLQLLDSLNPDPTDTTTFFLPVAVDEVRWHAAIRESCWINSTIRNQGAHPDPDLLLADMRIFDEEGQVAMELIGFRAKRMRGQLAHTPTTGEAANGAPAEEVLHKEELAALGPDERRQRLEDYVRFALASVLGLSPEELPADAEIAHLGFDSMMAIVLRNRIETEVGVVIPVSKMLESATPAGLASEMARLVTASKPAAAGRRARGNWTEGEI